MQPKRSSQYINPTMFCSLANRHWVLGCMQTTSTHFLRDQTCTRITYICSCKDELYCFTALPTKLLCSLGTAHTTHMKKSTHLHIYTSRHAYTAPKPTIMWMRIYYRPILKLIDENPLFFTILLPAGRGWRRVGLLQKWWWLMPRPACRNTSQYHSNYHSTTGSQC